MKTLSPLIFNTVLEAITNAVRQKKEIKGIVTQKEKTKVFAEDVST